MKDKWNFIFVWFFVVIISVTITNCNTSASESIAKSNIVLDEPNYYTNTDSIKHFFESVITNKNLLAKKIKILNISPLKTEEEVEEMKIRIEHTNDSMLRFISNDSEKFPTLLFKKNGAQAYFDNLSFNGIYVRGNSSPVFWSMKFKGINYSDNVNSKITIYQLEDNRYGIAIKTSNLSSSTPIFKVFVLKKFNP